MSKHTRRSHTASRMEQRRRFTEQFKTSMPSSKSNSADNYFSAGTVIGGAFTIESRIGEGGMGVVYRAQHHAMSNYYALKILAPELVNEQSWLRFKAEAKTLGSLNHPTLVKVYDLGVHENTVPYYSMDYLEGFTLEDAVSQRPLPLEQVLVIFISVLDGLAYAHRNGIVHRDIKPANIFLCPVATGFDVKILDFGISKFTQNNQFLTAAGEIFGSPFYMSPEQCRGQGVDTRSDIYSVGCSMFEALTAQVPFEGANSVETALMHEEDQPPLLSEVCDVTFPPSVDAVLAHALAKRPDHRYQSAKEMVIDLERIKAGKTVPMPEIILPRKITNLHSNRSLLLALSAAAILFVVVLAGIVSVFSNSGGNTAGQLSASSGSAVKSSNPMAELAIKDDFDISNADDISPRMAADVKEFFQSSPTYFSRQVKSGSRLVKGYSFPEKFCLGILGGNVDGKNYSCAAQGRLVLPFGAKPTFTANFIVRHFPEFLDYFRADDLSGFSQFESVERSERLLDSLGRLKSLTSLNLFNVGVKDTEIGPLNNLTGLESLSLQRNQISPLSLSRLHILQNLRGLRVDGGDSVSPLMKALAASRKLEHLAITTAIFTPMDVRYLASLGNLRELTLGRTNLTDSDLKILTSLQKLRVIDLKSSDLTSAAVDSLLKFKKLETIYIPDIEMTEFSKRQLRRQLTNLRSIRE